MHLKSSHDLFSKNLKIKSIQTDLLKKLKFHCLKRKAFSIWSFSPCFTPFPLDFTLLQQLFLVYVLHENSPYASTCFSCTHSLLVLLFTLSVAPLIHLFSYTLFPCLYFHSLFFPIACKIS